MRTKCNALILVAAVLCAAAAALVLAPTTSAAQTCWKVDCNTCCRTGHGVVCTQRACV
ncbi:MAG TPA: hypothetical protein VJS92_10945 [Candidatus Polarisedimenticolaceae bacterium]|nr:hypothetical protein [Candidatus Polarisedimenticolaceae bacterium]